jgi:multidrug efflux pump subunit AcrB
VSGLSGTSGLLPAMKRTIGYSWARTCRRGWLGRAVIGGLFAATLATLFLLPTVFGIVQKRASLKSPSLDPEDPDSPFAQKLENA